MLSLSIATGVFTLMVFVALRRARPCGIALDPWPYVMRQDPRSRFERMLPMDPDEPICNAEPPAELLRGMAAFGYSLTRCVYRPHPHFAGVAHTGVQVARGPEPAFGWNLYTWIQDERVTRQARSYRRRARWRRWLIRFATRLATS